MLRSTTMAVLLLTLAAAPAVAAGSSSSTTTETTAATPASPASTDPLAVKFGSLGADYDSAKALADGGKFAEAITALQALDKPGDPRVLNMLGYSTRKSGKPQDALVFYDKALLLAPEFTGAREYRGEAYVELKQFDKAKVELGEIEKLCGNKTCEEYADLAAAIKKADGGSGWFDWLF